jgi:Na+/pantothenate symporter
MFSKIFLTHPRSVDETYLEHAQFAAGFSSQLFLAATAAAIHSAVPCLFEKTASGIIAKLYARSHNRGGAKVAA